MSELTQPIGNVEASDGNVWAVRADGSRVELQPGDPVFQGDRIETGDAGAVGVEFTDGSAFSLGANGDLVIDEMIYNPATQEGSSFFSVAQGAFSFVSGAIAKTTPDGMMVQTPVATIGVRGTKVVGEAGPEGTENSFTLLREDDGTTGEIVVYNEGGIQVLNQPFQTVAISDPLAGVPDPVIVTQDHVDSRFSSTLRVLPAVNHGGNRPDTEDSTEDESGPPLPQDGAPGEGDAAIEEEAAVLVDEAAGPPEVDVLDESLVEAGPEVEGEQQLDEELGPQEPGLPEGGEIAGPGVEGPLSAMPASGFTQTDGTDFGPGIGSDLPGSTIDETLTTPDAFAAGSEPAATAGIAGLPGTLQQAIQAGLQAGYTSEQVFNALSTLSDSGSLSGATTPGSAATTIAGAADNRTDPGEDDPVAGQVLNGGNGADTLTGGAGDDTLTGGSGADTLIGGAGDDTLIGGNASDRLEGGAGANILTGNNGPDTFAFSGSADGYAKTTNGAATAAELAEVTRITDFESGTDKLAFDALGFDGISSLVDGVTAIRLHDVFDGTNVDASSFQSGSPVLIYDDTGTFYYDANGAGDGYTVVAKVDGQVQFSDLEMENGVSV